MITKVSFCFFLLSYLMYDYFNNLIFIFVCATVIPLIFNLSLIYSMKTIELKIVELNQQLEFDKKQDEDIKLKAEKLLRLNQSAIKSYYEQNLLNNLYILFNRRKNKIS